MKKFISLITATILVLGTILCVPTIAATDWLIANAVLSGANYGTKSTETIGDSIAVSHALRLQCNTKPASANMFATTSKIDSVSIIASNVYVLSFYAKANTTAGKITISINNSSGVALTSYTYFISGQWTQICMPFTAVGTEYSVTVAAGEIVQDVMIGNMQITASGSEFTKAKSGYFMEQSSEWQNYEIPWSDGLGLSDCMDVIANGNYIYAISNSNLYVLSIAENKQNPELIKTLSKVGNLRQMSMTDDGKGLLITARGDAGFAFDISDPADPKLASRIDSLEMATGIDVQGKYCYIADRIYGIDIVDISDLYNPVMISNIPIGECQDCQVYNGYLYAGVWGECRVKICDVRDVDNPKQVNTIELDGRGDGVTIRDGILYAATGHMNRSSTSQATSPGYGLGNGLEIYDISNPMSPVQLSVSKAEGRFYCSSPDIWRVTVAGHYAYMASTYNGIYVYDTTNKRLPKRVAHIDVVANKGETGYSDLNTRSTFVYPFDTTQTRHGALIDCDVANGYMYIANSSKDLYVLKANFAANSSDKNDSDVLPSSTYANTYFSNDYASLGFSNVKTFKPDSQVWASAHYGNYTYVASGTDGICILDNDLNLVKKYPSKDITMDIQIYGNTIYTAEARSGLCIYSISTDDPTQITYKGSCASPNGSVRQLQLSPKAKYAIVQTGNLSAIIDVQNINAPVLYKLLRYSMVYQKQVCVGAAANRYMLVFANGSKTVVCDFGENDSFTQPIIDETWSSGLSQTYGTCSDGDNMLATMNNTICYFNPGDTSLYSSTLSSNSSVAKYTVSGASGYPSVSGDYAFLSNGSKGKFMILKLGDRTSAPTTYKNVTFHGNPGIVTTVGKRVYLPLGYAGLVSFEIADLEPNLAKLSSLSYRTDTNVSSAVDGFNTADADGNYTIKVTNDVKKVTISATVQDANSTIEITNSGIIDIGAGQREATVTTTNGSSTNTYKITVDVLTFENAKTYTVPQHEDINMELEVNPKITSVRADSGDNTIYPSEPLAMGSRFYSDRASDRMLYIDVGNNLIGTTPILDPVGDVRTSANTYASIKDDYYYRFRANRGCTVIIKYFNALANYSADSSWSAVYENAKSGFNSDMTTYKRTDISNTIPSFYQYDDAAKYPYFCTMYQYAADASAGVNYKTSYPYTYYKHFTAGEIITIDRSSIGSSHNMLVLLDWDDASSIEVANYNFSTGNATVNSSSDVNANVIVAAYDADGNMLSVKKVTSALHTGANDVSVPIETSDATYVKVFVWNAMGVCNALCNAESFDKN